MSGGLAGSKGFGSAGESCGRADAKHFFPTRPRKRSYAVQSTVNDKAGHFVDDMLEIKFSDAVALHIGSGIQEIDGVGNSVLDGKFDGIHFVAEGFVDRLRIFDDASAELGREVIVIDEIFSLFGIVVNGSDI